MVDDEQPAGPCVPAQPIEKAAGRLRTGGTQTEVRLATDFLPEQRGGGQPGQFGAVRVDGFCDPAVEGLPALGEQLARGSGLQLAKTVEAQVILAALDAECLQVRVDVLPDEGDLFFQNLVLEVAGVRGHHHPGAAEHGGNEIGQGLAQPGFRLDHQGRTAFFGLLFSRGETLRHGPSHFQLTGAEFVAVDTAGEHSLGAEQAIHGTADRGCHGRFPAPAENGRRAVNAPGRGPSHWR